MSNILKGKVVLITGGSRGLGAATAEAFAEHGADVAISYAASADKAEAVVAKLKAKGARAIAIKSDQSDLSSAKPLIDAVIAEFGKLDILVNNAGIAIQGQLVDDPTLDGAKYNHQWQVNVLGTIANTRAAAPRMSDGGRIVFIGSLLGSYVPFPGVADYAGTKWALAGYAKGIARDLGPRNITVNVVQPGIMPRTWPRTSPGSFRTAKPSWTCIRSVASRPSKKWRKPSASSPDLPPATSTVRL
jgi:NAD(P)-dependent dehydrogenase (short-subunit alcohol dehydrogenase family)